MKKIILFLILSINIYSQEVGVIISAGPGFNTGNLGKWINSYQVGADLSLEMISENHILRFSFSPETSELKTKELNIINGKVWPKDIQVNFMSFQLLYGYPIETGKNHFTFYGGMTLNWLYSPREYDDDFKLAGNKNQGTPLSFGPILQFSWKRPIKTKIIWRINLPVTLEAGIIFPRFGTIDRNLTGEHVFVKLGFYFGKYFSSDN